MTTQALQLIKTRYMVRPKVMEKKATKQELLRELDEITELVSKHWQGSRDAVAEIRYQRGGNL